MPKANSPIWAKSTKSVATWLYWLLITSGVAGLTLLPSTYKGYSVRVDLSNGLLNEDEAYALMFDAASPIRSSIASLLTIPIVILLIIWTNSGYRNIKLFGVEKLPRSPNWAVGGWFVPFYNVIVEKQIINSVWRASAPGELEPDWNKGPTERLFTIGWILFFTGFALSLYTFFEGGISVTAGVNQLKSDFRVSGVSEQIYFLRFVSSLLFPISQIFAAFGIRNIAKRYDEKRHAIAETQSFHSWIKD